MKKLLIVALAIIPVLFACKKSSTTPVSNLETPKYAAQAAKVEIKKPIKVTSKKGDVEIKKIDFLRSGRYVAEAAIVTKAEENTITLTGTWTYTEGKGYEVKGDIEATVAVSSASSSEASVTITTTAEGAQTSEAKVEETKVQAGSTEDKIYRTWKIDHIILSEFSKLGSTSVRATSISTLVTEIKNKGINLGNAEANLLEHEINEITFDEGVMLILFKNGTSFKGNLPNLGASGSATKFTFDLSSLSDKIGNVSGTIDFKGDNAVVSINVPDIESIGSGKAEVTLAQVK